MKLQLNHNIKTLLFVFVYLGVTIYTLSNIVNILQAHTIEILAAFCYTIIGIGMFLLCLTLTIIATITIGNHTRKNRNRAFTFIALAIWILFIIEYQSNVRLEPIPFLPFLITMIVTAFVNFLLKSTSENNSNP